MLHRVILFAGLWLSCGTTGSAQITLSQELLDAYFKTAGVCTTSQVLAIRDTGDIVTIEIAIEPATRKGLATMNDTDRDNWFSLHCPPEIHGVWHQEHPPLDIHVTGELLARESYTLSCVEFQQNQWNQDDKTLKGKIRDWLKRLSE